MNIGLKKYKELGVDVEERFSWGIDLFTFRVLMDLLPLNFDEEYKRKFVEEKLVFALNFIDKEGYELTKGCQFIVKNNQALFDDQDIALALRLLTILESNDELRTSISAYSKGIGMFCKNKEGIQKNELINQYFGEIYPPWYWFEKQDLITKCDLDEELNDFYNIWMERFKEDDKGYYLLMVDPNSKGNFTSRMSHSCLPNCNTVLTVSKEKYTVGMYATEAVKYGEELTFDYNSVTEKLYEHEKSVCLCSKYHCRGHYISLADTNENSDFFAKNHNYFKRASIIFKTASTDKWTEQDVAILEEFSFRTLILETAPLWLMKWTVEILKFIKEENANILENVRESHKEDDSEESNEYFELIAKTTTDARVQNLVITIDKVKRVLLLMKVSEAPVKKLTEDQVVDYLWKGEKSVRRQLIALLKEVLERTKNEKVIFALTELICNLEKSDSSKVQKIKGKLMETALIISSLRSIESFRKKVKVKNLVYFLKYVSMTEHFFVRNHKYKQAKGEKIEITQREIAFTKYDQLREFNLDLDKLDSVVQEGQKVYEIDYIFNQLNYWFRQIVDKESEARAANMSRAVSIPLLSNYTSKGDMKFDLRKIIKGTFNGENVDIHGDFEDGVFGSPFLDKLIESEQAWVDVDKIISYD